MVGLSSWVYARSSIAAQISGVSACQVKTGFGGLHGNKGALVVRFLVKDTSVCWVNCHLAAGQSQTPQRNTDAANILRLSRLPAPPLSIVGSRHLWVDGGDGTRITDHAVGLWSGDLNYRISMDRTHVERAIQARDWSVLWTADQLRQQREANPLHALRSWTEPPIDFAPTYKYDRGSDTYDTSEKRRTPAWCDRILHRSTPQVRLRRSGSGNPGDLEGREDGYGERWEVRASDHRPIAASFSLRIKTVDGSEEARVAEKVGEERWQRLRESWYNTMYETLLTALIRHGKEGMEGSARDILDRTGGDLVLAMDELGVTEC